MQMQSFLLRTSNTHPPLAPASPRVRVTKLDVTLRLPHLQCAGPGRPDGLPQVSREDAETQRNADAIFPSLSTSRYRPSAAPRLRVSNPT